MQKMTIDEWEKERRRLQSALTRARTNAKNKPTLAEKIAAKIVVRAADEALFYHKINYHELTSHRN